MRFSLYFVFSALSVAKIHRFWAENGLIFVFWRVWRAEKGDFWPPGRFWTEKRHAAAKWDEHRVGGPGKTEIGSKSKVLSPSLNNSSR